MKLKFLALALAFSTFGIAQVKKKTTSTKKTVVTKKKTITPKVTNGIFAEIETAKGKIEVELLYKKTPITVANFVTLAEGTNTFVDQNLKGKHFYDGLKFHRVITKNNGDPQDFMIQGGDPQGTGMGGPGYKFKDEFTDDTFDKPGILAMANAGPTTNGSQFFITVAPTTWLNKIHTIFGFVTNGQNVVNSIKKDDLINKVTIKRVGTEAKAFNAEEVFSKYMNSKAEEEKLENQKAELQKQAALVEFANATTTDSGLKYIVQKQGTGTTHPTVDNTVKVHYTGMLLDGKIFDSSVQRGEPIEFPLNKVIKGWTEGVQLMRVGDKFKFLIPYALAYGERGAGGVIPPKADLIFEVELLDIK